MKGSGISKSLIRASAGRQGLLWRVGATLPVALTEEETHAAAALGRLILVKLKGNERTRVEGYPGKLLPPIEKGNAGEH